MFHAFIWLSEKNKIRISGRKKKIIIVGPYCSKCWNWEFLTYFFTEINVFVITQRVKYRKKVPLGTGTEFQVPIRYRTVSNVNGNPTLVTVSNVKSPPALFSNCLLQMFIEDEVCLLQTVFFLWRFSSSFRWTKAVLWQMRVFLCMFLHFWRFTYIFLLFFCSPLGTFFSFPPFFFVYSQKL